MFSPLKTVQALKQKNTQRIKILENMLIKLGLNEWLLLSLSEWTPQKCMAEATEKKVKKGSVGSDYLSVEKAYLSVSVWNEIKTKSPPLDVPKEGLNLTAAADRSLNR
ncbi:hypothetical protein [Runella sp.]|jgi:hypothetical protein|uniref:hypothetical protein n=1 Tax=Runella sp. TaxID=1960881 RepID=UPI002604D90A|nr:hypothetical protein [Runella sp.]